MSINVFSPVLLGFNDGHWILRVELACFRGLFFVGFRSSWLGASLDGLEL